MKTKANPSIKDPIFTYNISEYFPNQFWETAQEIEKRMKKEEKAKLKKYKKKQLLELLTQSLR